MTPVHTNGKMFKFRINSELSSHHTNNFHSRDFFMGSEGGSGSGL